MRMRSVLGAPGWGTLKQVDLQSSGGRLIRRASQLHDVVGKIGMEDILWIRGQFRDPHESKTLKRDAVQ